MSAFHPSRTLVLCLLSTQRRHFASTSGAKTLKVHDVVEDYFCGGTLNSNGSWAVDFVPVVMVPVDVLEVLEVVDAAPKIPPPGLMLTTVT